jgi:uncharacterized integral membrane protein
VHNSYNNICTVIVSRCRVTNRLRVLGVPVIIIIIMEFVFSIKNGKNTYTHHFRFASQLPLFTINAYFFIYSFYRLY